MIAPNKAGLIAASVALIINAAGDALSIRPITTNGSHSITDLSALPKPSSSNGFNSESIKASPAALIIRATEAAINPALLAG